MSAFWPNFDETLALLKPKTPEPTPTPCNTNKHPININATAEANTSTSEDVDVNLQHLKTDNASTAPKILLISLLILLPK